MEKIAEKLTSYIIKKEVISNEDYEIYKYGFLTGIEILLCIITCFILSMKLQMIYECVTFFLVFIALRSFVGGLHMNSFMACYWCSVFTLFLTLMLIKHHPVSNEASMAVIISESLLVWKMNPVENINRPVDEGEAKIFSLRIKKILAAICVSALFVYLLKWNEILNTTMYTLLVILISMILGMIKNKADCRGHNNGNFADM